MKRYLFGLLTLISLVSYGQTAEEIVQRFSKTMGGLDSFSRVKTAKITGVTSLAGQEFPITIYIVNGKAMRTEVSVMNQSVVNVYKDGKGWTMNPLSGATSSTDVDGATLEDFKVQASLASQLMNYKTNGSKIESQGQEKVEGVNANKIKMTASDGRVSYWYLSADDNTVLKTISTRDLMGQNVEVETFYSDIKMFNGLKFPMSRTLKIAGDTFQSMDIQNIELNVPVDDRIFEKG